MQIPVTIFYLGNSREKDSLDMLSSYAIFSDDFSAQS